MPIHLMAVVTRATNRDDLTLRTGEISLKEVPLDLSKENIRKQQQADIATLEKIQQITKRKSTELFLKDGILFRKAPGNSMSNQFWLPKSLRRVAMAYIHEDLSGHLAHEKTFNNLRSRFYWPGYEREVEQFVAGCLTCQTRNAPPKVIAPLMSLKADYPNDLVMWDLTGPLTRSLQYNTMILVIIDGFTHFVEAYSLPDQQAKTVADCLVHYALHYGSPRQLHSDRGANFTSEVMKEVSKVLGTKQSHTSGMTPWANGCVERFNRTLKAMLSKTISDSQTDWDKHLLPVVYAYNTTVHDSTGFSPFFLQFGRAPLLPVDVLLDNPPRVADKLEYAIKLRRSLQYAFKAARMSMEKLRRQNKEYKEATNKIADEFSIGQLVMLHNPATPKGKSKKLMCQYYGPYTILSRANAVDYVIRLFDGSSLPKLVHRNRLKPFQGDRIEDLGSANDIPTGEILRPLDYDVVDQEDNEIDSGQRTIIENKKETTEKRVDQDIMDYSRPLSIPLFDLADYELFKDGQTTYKINEIFEKLNKNDTTKQLSSGPVVVSKSTSVPTVVLESDKQSTSEQATSPMPTLGIPRPLTPGMLTPGRLSYAEAVSGTPKIQKGNESSETVVSSTTTPSNQEDEDGSEVDEQESEENEATSLVQTKNVRFRDSVEEMETETEDLTSTSQSESTDKESEQSITEKVISQ